MTDWSDYRAVTLGYLILWIGLGPVLPIVAEPGQRRRPDLNGQPRPRLAGASHSG